jgi:hypothetical protein
MNSHSAIFCFGEENMNSYEENEKRKDGAKIQFCTVFALCAKMAQDYLRKLRLALSIKRKVLRCAASKTTLVGACRNYFFVFVSDRSKSGFAENWIHICFS